MSLIGFFSRPFRSLLIWILLIGTITSCTTPDRIQTSPTVPPTTPTFPSPSPSLTPTPVTEKIYFLDSDQSPPIISQSISSILVELTQSQGYEFITSKERPILEFAPGARMVIALPPDPGLEAISKEHPDIQFISIGIADLQPSSNLSIIGSEGFRDDHISFIAGYISTVVTKDFRTGIINQASSDWIERIHRSFANGKVYYCGICQLTYPPYYDYPILTTLSVGASDSEWQNAADLLVSQAVKTVFIYSNEINLSSMEYLSQKGINLLGVEYPPQDLEESWIVTLRMAPERIIKAHWDDLVSQRGGWVEEIPIILENINEDLLSIGKQQWVQEVMDEVFLGYIGTGANNENGS